MEVIIVLLLLLAGWTQQSNATSNCSAYLSSQPLTLNLLCPSAICRLELFNMRGCNSDCPSCNIADCNKVYNLCNISSSQRPSSTGHVAQSNEQPITCTFVVQINSEPMGVMVTCEKGDDQLTFMSTNTTCKKDLGINCNLSDPVNSCIKQYSFCMEPRPNTYPPWEEMVRTTVLNNQCTKSVTTQITCTSTVNRAIIPAIGAIMGLLVVLLTVVTMGWVYTYKRKVELGLNISNAMNLNLNNNPAYVTKTTCQRNPAYVVTDISTGEPDKSQAVTNEIEPTYEMVQPSSAQAKQRPGSETGEDNQLEPTYETVQQIESSAQMEKGPGSPKNEDDYNKFDREVPLPEGI